MELFLGVLTQLEGGGGWVGDPGWPLRVNRACRLGDPASS
jgi:hypothetical protein